MACQRKGGPRYQGRPHLVPNLEVFCRFYSSNTHDGSGWCWYICWHDWGILMGSMLPYIYIIHGSYGILTKNICKWCCRPDIESFESKTVLTELWKWVFQYGCENGGMINSKWQFEEGTWPWTNGFKDSPSGQVPLLRPQVRIFVRVVCDLRVDRIVQYFPNQESQEWCFDCCPPDLRRWYWVGIGCHCFFAVWRYNFWDGGPLDSGDLWEAQIVCHRCRRRRFQHKKNPKWQPKVKIFLYLSTWWLALSSGWDLVILYPRPDTIRKDSTVLWRAGVRLQRLAARSERVGNDVPPWQRLKCILGNLAFGESFGIYCSCISIGNYAHPGNRDGFLGE